MQFSDAMDHLERCESARYVRGPHESAWGFVTRIKLDEKGNLHWRRVIFRFHEGVDGIYERWPSGHVCPYTPSQEDMLATDWEIASSPELQ